MTKFTKKDKLSGKKMGYICLITAILLILLVIAIIVLGYFVSFQDKESEMRDGLNRLLDMENLPSALKFLPQWAGYVWFILDCLIILASVIIIDKLFVKSKIYFTGIKNVDF